MTISQNANKPLELDAVIVGAGFSGIYALHRLRDQLHVKVKILEAGPPGAIGGVWYWNNYPGARVDMETPYYSFGNGFEEVWRTWNWSEEYASQKEMNAYFQHVDKVMSVSKDCIFNARVKGAEFDVDTARWTLQTEHGPTVVAKYIIPATGLSSKQHVPEWKGIESFQGSIYYPSSWPSEGVDVKGKRVAIIGTGATGVQIIQDWAKEAGELFVFLRTPNPCLPMCQKKYDPAKQEQTKQDVAKIFASFRDNGTMLKWEVPTKKYAEQTREEWEKVLNELYDIGGLGFWVASTSDWAIDAESNRFLYDFWASKTRKRIRDPVKRDLLAPLEPAKPFGTKRISLEQDYFEQFNRPNVHVVDVKTDPIMEVRPRGIVTESNNLYEVDVIVIATGYDAYVGGLFNLGIRDTSGVELRERWKNGVLSYLGVMVPGFPNLFIAYGAQTPAATTCAPMFIECQAGWIRDMIRKVEETPDIKYVEVRPESAQAWREDTMALARDTLFVKATSWYNGANIPGKPVEILIHLGAYSQYKQRCIDSLGGDFERAFVVY